MHPSRASALLLAAVVLLSGCEDEIVVNRWRSFTVVQAEALDEGGVPVPGVTLRLHALGLSCAELLEGSVQGLTATTDTDGVAILTLSVDSGPIGDACVGIHVEAPPGWVLDGTPAVEVPVRFVTRGQALPAELDLVLLPAAP